MTRPDEMQTFIRETAAAESVRWSRHALSKAVLETITLEQIQRALETAEIIEVYPHEHRYLPDCLVLLFVSSGQPLHCVVGINEMHNYILVVTVYRPDREEWEDDWRTRK